MALQAQSSGNSAVTFTPADCDGLSFSTAIVKFVFEPLSQELGVLRSDSWVWLQATITANVVGVDAGKFIWPIKLALEDILPAIRFLAELAEKSFHLDRVRPDAIRSMATRITKRWHDLIGFLRRGELVASGISNDRHKRLSAEFWSDDNASIDILTGNCGIICYGKFNVVWSDLQLWVSEKDFSAVTTTKIDVDNSRSTREPSLSTVLPRRPRGPDGVKTRAAAEKLRNMLRSREITPAELINPIGEGGLKQDVIAYLLGVKSRTTAKSIVELVLSEPEFAA
jgi:hypothetical protein